MYKPRHPPYDHQKRAMAASWDKEFFALLMAMRTGKTKVTIDTFGQLADRGRVFDMLVVAPAGVYMTWIGEIIEHWDPKIPIVVHAWSAQDKSPQKLDSFMEMGGIRVLLVNVEALSLVKRAQDLCVEFVKQRGALVVVDESTSIKNRRAKRTKFLTKILAPLAKYRRILSGLPTPRSPLDAWAQYEFLSKGLLGATSYTAFEQQYAVTRLMPVAGRYIRIVVGYKNVPKLAERVKPFSFRVLLEDCYDLPPKIYAKREVRLHPDQEKLYKDMAKKSMAQLSETAHVTATIVIAQMLRMHQILCGHVQDELGVQHVVPSRKNDELLALLEEHTGKAVIWCSYDFNIQDVADLLRGEYGESSVARFWGGNKATREGEEKQFKEDPACRFMVATPAAGGRGRDWSVADLVVYFSSTPDLEHRSQSEERVQKVGKTRSVLYVDLVAPKTIEDKILRALRGKINLAAVITGDNYREWLI